MVQERQALGATNTCHVDWKGARPNGALTSTGIQRVEETSVAHPPIRFRPRRTGASLPQVIRDQLLATLPSLLNNMV